MNQGRAGFAAAGGWRKMENAASMFGQVQIAGSTKRLPACCALAVLANLARVQSAGISHCVRPSTGAKPANARWAGRIRNSHNYSWPLKAKTSRPDIGIPPLAGMMVLWLF